MKTILVTGTDTNVGKTWITSLLVRRMRSHGLRTGAYKPVCSGAEFDGAGRPIWSDVESLRAACGNEPSADLVCPQRFLAPVAPNVAARMEHREVNDALLADAARAWNDHADYLVVEGAGGIFCPLSDSSTVMELALALQPVIIVVAANRLGVINHTRLTVEALQSSGLTVIAVVLNEITPSPKATSDENEKTRPNDASLPSNAEQLQHWILELPFFHCSWGGEHLTRIPRTAESALTANPDDSEASLVRLILKDQRCG